MSPISHIPYMPIYIYERFEMAIFTTYIAFMWNKITEPHSSYLFIRNGFSFKSSISWKSSNKLVRFCTRRIKIYKYDNRIERKNRKKNPQQKTYSSDVWCFCSKSHRFPAIWSVQCKCVKSISHFIFLKSIHPSKTIIQNTDSWSLMSRHSILNNQLTSTAQFHNIDDLVISGNNMRSKRCEAGVPMPFEYFSYNL